MKFSLKNYLKIFKKQDKASRLIQFEILNQLRTKERSFNKIHVKGTVVTKFVYDLEKGKKEIFFYKNNNQKIRSFFPKFIKSERKKNFVSYEIEFIPALDLSALLNRKLINSRLLASIFKSLDGFFEKTPKKIISNLEWQKKTRILLVEKLNSRWKTYQKTYNSI